MKIWLKIALNAVKLPKFELVNGKSWSPRKMMVKDLRASSCHPAGLACISTYITTTFCFWVTVMLRDCCLSCLSVCNVGVLQPNGWMDQDATWYGGRPRPRRHCVRWDPVPQRKGAQQPPLFGLCLLWTNGRPSQQLLSSCCCKVAQLANS